MFFLLYATAHYTFIKEPEYNSITRCKGFNRKNVSDFFDILEKTIDENQLSVSRIFNMDVYGLLLEKVTSIRHSLYVQVLPVNLSYQCWFLNEKKKKQIQICYLAANFQESVNSTVLDGQSTHLKFFWSDWTCSD